MAQRTEKEETEFKVPETLTSCITTTTVAAASSSSSSTAPPSSDPPRSTATPLEPSKPASLERTPARSDGQLRSSRSEAAETEDERRGRRSRREINRCSGCKRKVGLTAFRCRCGELFCWEHRYSDRHDCSFDYKAAGREAIAKENPVVKAPKILKV